MTTPNDTALAPKNRRLQIVGGVALLVLIWAGAKFIHGRTHVSTDNAQVDGHITPIAPKVQAFVDEVRVDDNARVKAGDTLVILDDRDLRVRLAQMEADLAAARAGAASKAQAGAAGSAVASAEANFRKAEQDLARVKTLAAQQIVAASALDAAQAAFDAAKANLDAARRNQSAAENNVLGAQAALTGADAR